MVRHTYLETGMKHVNASLFVDADIPITTTDRPHPNAPAGAYWQIVTLDIGGLTLHMSGDSDEDIAANLNRLIKPLIELRQNAESRIKARAPEPLASTSTFDRAWARWVGVLDAAADA